MGSRRSRLKVDTKGMCFLCLKSSFQAENLADEVNSTIIAFKMLLRYLKVDVSKLFMSTSPEGWKTISVTLCEDCSSVTSDFLELFQAFESIRMQLDLCVGQLLQFMEEGGKDPERELECGRRLNTGDNVEGSMSMPTNIQRLRKETMEKCSQKAACSLPRISLEKETSPAKTSLTERSLQLLQEGMDNVNEESEVTGSIIGSLSEESSPLVLTEGIAVMDEDTTCSYAHDSPSEKAVENVETLFTSEASLCSEFPLSRNDSDKMLREKPWTCSSCGKDFRLKRNLKNHQFQKHMMTVLSGRLPDSVSSDEVNRAVKRITARTGVTFKNGKTKRQSISIFECIWCKQKIWSILKVHLLDRHLDEVVREMDCIRSQAKNDDGSQCLKMLESTVTSNQYDGMSDLESLGYNSARVENRDEENVEVRRPNL